MGVGLVDSAAVTSPQCEAKSCPAWIRQNLASETISHTIVALLETKWKVVTRSSQNSFG